MSLFHDTHTLAGILILMTEISHQKFKSNMIYVCIRLT